MKLISDTVFDGNVCSVSDIQNSYFETDNIAVFGGSEVSEKELQMIATFAEEGLSVVADKYEIAVNELLDLRPFYTAEALVFAKYALMRRELFEELESVVLPADFDENNFDRDKYAYDYFYSLSKLEQSDLLDRVAAYRNRDLMRYRDDYNILEMPRRLIICASANNLNSVATAGSHGLQVQPPAFASEHNRENNFEKYRRIVTHELVHVSMFIVSTRGNENLFPLWFAEGVAEYLSGGIIAQSVSERRNITESKTEINFDEYDDAARVIEYIVDDLGNGVRSIYELMLYMRERATGDENLHYSSFEEAFEEAFVDLDSTKLEYSELQNEYFDRLL